MPTKNKEQTIDINVPPVMAAQISYQIYLQWLKQINP